MPVVTGLDTMLVPMVVFALLGSSRHLVVAADSAPAAILAAGLVGVPGRLAASCAVRRDGRAAGRCQPLRRVQRHLRRQRQPGPRHRGSMAPTAWPSWLHRRSLPVTAGRRTTEGWSSTASAPASTSPTPPGWPPTSPPSPSTGTRRAGYAWTARPSAMWTTPPPLS